MKASAVALSPPAISSTTPRSHVMSETVDQRRIVYIGDRDGVETY